MHYVFDTSSLIILFNYYKREIFPTLWSHFDQLVQEGKIISAKEVFNELSVGKEDSLNLWSKTNKGIFFEPTNLEQKYITEKIFSNQKYRKLLDKGKILHGGYAADPFLIASAGAFQERCLVTQDGFDQQGNVSNKIRMALVCKELGINCENLEGFMKHQKWTF